MVNIDTVYQRVLAIANKEQRGYITPLEFNLLANQAQLDVFEQYFYDRNQTARGPGNDTHFSDVDSMLDEKISFFETNTIIDVTKPLPLNLYRLGSITVDPDNTGSRVEVKYVNEKDYTTMAASPLLRSTRSRPVYTRDSVGITIYAENNNGVVTQIPSAIINYVFVPVKVEWGYDVVGEKALYNASPNKTNHFQHHPSEETELVVKILELSGVVIKNPNVVQFAAGEDNQKVQQEKQ